MRGRYILCFKEKIPVYSLPTAGSNIGRPAEPRWKPRPLPIVSEPCPVDRFIPKRKGQNFEASHYYLMKEPTNKTKKHFLNVFQQVHSLNESWRKRSLGRALENAVGGAGRRRVLTLTQSSASGDQTPGSIAGTFRDIYAENPLADGVWPVRPREKPLIGVSDTLLEIPRFRGGTHHSLLDWGQTNFIAAAVGTTVCLFDARSQFASERKFFMKDGCTAIKWNHAGDNIAIAAGLSKIAVHDLESQKILLDAECVCVSESLCYITCIAWSENDKHVVTGCKSGRLSVHELATSTVRTILAHRCDVLTVSFSLDFRHLATSGKDKAVRVVEWPSLNPFLEIGYFEPPTAIAWHPWQNGMMCVGGGLGDGSLTLWNINTHKTLGYRMVNFCGGVDHLMWNKHTGELVVNWFIVEEDKYLVVIAVLASLNRICDVIPLPHMYKVHHVLWSPNSKQLATQYRECVSIWNFFGNNNHGRGDNRLQKKNELKSKSANHGGAFPRYTVR